MTELCPNDIIMLTDVVLMAEGGGDGFSFGNYIIE
jgi:hypothetical protein